MGRADNRPVSRSTLGAASRGIGCDSLLTYLRATWRFSVVKVEAQGRVGIIRLGDCGAGVDVASAATELCVALDAFAADNVVVAVVVIGSDRAFARASGGNDFTVAGGEAVGWARKPVVAAVAFGTRRIRVRSCPSAFACDALVASSALRFFALGIPFAMGGARSVGRIDRIVPPAGLLDVAIAVAKRIVNETRRYGTHRLAFSSATPTRLPASPT